MQCVFWWRSCWCRCMSVNIELYQYRSEPYDVSVFQQLAQDALRASHRVDDRKKRVTISVACVSEKEMQRVNMQLRDKDVVTDVLSIGEYSDERDITIEAREEIFLGEIILCYNYIARCAEEAMLDLDREYFTIFVHGVLHLLGYRHGVEMFQLQDRVSEDYLVKTRGI